MKELKRISSLIFLLAGSAAFAFVGILSLYTAVIIVPSPGETVFKAEKPIVWLVQTISTFAVSAFTLYLFAQLKRRRD